PRAPNPGDPGVSIAPGRLPCGLSGPGARWPAWDAGQRDPGRPGARGIAALTPEGGSYIDLRPARHRGLGSPAASPPDSQPSSTQRRGRPTSGPLSPRTP